MTPSQPAAEQPSGGARPRLEVHNITKLFPGVVANKEIDLALNNGEILALLGENGAGKSTLMNIVYGLYQPTEGQIQVNGRPVELHSPRDAIDLGIGMVHQHFQLVPVMSVVDNVMLGSESVNRGLLDRESVSSQISELADRYNMPVDPDAIIEDLPVGVQQRVEILKALYRQADILILDEPTSVLTPQEIEGLFEVMELLRNQGKSIIFITHKLKEVLRVADRIAVLRRGQMVGEADPAEVSQQDLASLMVGRKVTLEVQKEPASAGKPLLRIRNLEASNDLGELALRSVSLDVRVGEIVGVAGVQGNGQTELVEVITGLRQAAGGSVHINGQDMTNAPPRRITEEGAICHVPEDRHMFGMVGAYSVADNLVLSAYYKRPFSSGLTMNEQAIAQHAEELVARFDVRTPTVRNSGASLSGGNQQKMVVAREFSRPIRLLVAAQPTRGIDVGSIEFIHSQIVAKRDEGVAVLLVSYELDEIMALSDRIAIMFDGRISAVLSRSDATRQQIGLLMAGAGTANESAPR